MSATRWGAGFAATGRFVAEIDAASKNSGPLRPGYVLAGDEIFLLDRCRSAVLRAFVQPDLRDFCLSDFDLASTTIFEILDRAQTPSLALAGQNPLQGLGIGADGRRRRRGNWRPVPAPSGGGLRGCVPHPARNARRLATARGQAKAAPGRTAISSAPGSRRW